MSQMNSSGFGTGHRLAAVVLVSAFGASAHAGVAPYLTMEWFGSNDGIAPVMYHMNEHSDTKKYLGGGTWNFMGSQVGADQSWLLEWNMTANANNGGGTTLGGPGSSFVTADLAVTNTSSTTQSFWALVTLVLDNPIIGGSLMNGQASAAVTDFLGNGATLGTISDGMHTGAPIYSGRIDGVSQQYLMESPFSLSAGPFSSNSTSETFGQPTPLVGPDATSISVWLRFELTPGDTANVVGMFEVAALVPAPASLPLLAALGLFAGGRRRRGN
jgi:hypothetical protein